MNNENVVIWQPGMSLEQLEKKTILAAFRFYRSNKTQTANSLGIAIRTLDAKLQQYADKEKLQATAAPTRAQIIERNQKDVHRTGPRGEDHRVQAQPKQPSTNGSGEIVSKTGPSGRMSEQELADLRARKAERQKLKASKAGLFEQNVQNDDSAERGLSVEPAVEAGSEHPVSLPEREEIQKVSPTVATSNRGQRHGQAVRAGNEKSSNQIHNKSDKK